MRVMIATPAYSGKVDIPYAISLSETYHLLVSNGIEVRNLINATGSLLVSERNRIIHAFWESDCTHLLCIDADLGWPAQAVMAMLESGKEFVAGVYPARGTEHQFYFRPEPKADGSIVTEKHLLKMQYIPAGFMLISRSVIEKMRDKHTDLIYMTRDFDPNKPEPIYAFFNTEIWNDEFWGEDYVFCRKAREAGVEIWVDPLIQFNHAGTVAMLTQALTSDRSQAHLRKVA